MKPHKHAKLIKAWADGAEIQVLNLNNEWATLKDINPSWDVGYEYRIKPERKKDFFQHWHFSKNSCHQLPEEYWKEANVVIIFNGETEKPIHATVVS